MPTPYELEREANIKRNRALLESLEVDQAIADLGIPKKRKERASPTAKPGQPAKKTKREPAADTGPRRQSTRLRRSGVVDPKETPQEKKQRIKEEEERRAKEAEEQLIAEELARAARQPRHHDLELDVLLKDAEPEDTVQLNERLQAICREPQPRRVAEYDSFTFEKDKDDELEVTELRNKLSKLRVVSRAKVTHDRIYSAAYHPEPTKDLIFFGDKHGELGIWDAQAPVEGVADEDDDVAPKEDAEGGKYWRLQMHWPATSKSSISSIKFNPVDSHTVYTSSYDCTIRNLSLGSGLSKEIFTLDDTLITSIDLTPNGHEMWVSDGAGGVSHLDLRQEKGKASWYALSDQKIGSVSINPTRPHYLLTASNSRALRIWDTRQLVPLASVQSPEETNYDHETIKKFYGSSGGKGLLRGEWDHHKSVSSAYWDPRGKSVVSTSYDDNVRLWDFSASALNSHDPFKSSRPFANIKHNCQTGKWLTILRAQWTQNPDVYPHFTIGNMKHSLDIFSCKGDLIASLSDKAKISAVQAVTCSHPSILERAASGNASGRCVLWAPEE